MAGGENTALLPGPLCLSKRSWPAEHRASRMKVLFSLIVLSISLALSNGSCIRHPINTELSNDALEPPASCADPYDGRSYSLGAVWNTVDCLQCKCEEHEVTCCLRYPQYASFPGCGVILNAETCTYIIHEIGDPSKPCTPTS